MKNILTAILILASASAWSAGFTISSYDSRSGGQIWAWAGTGAGNTGPTNAAYAAVVPPGSRTPVITWIKGMSDMWASNNNPIQVSGSLMVWVPTNYALTVGAAVAGSTNYVLSGSGNWTNDYGNAMPSNTCLLAYNKTNGKLTRCEPYQAGWTGAADYGTNIILRHAVTLSSGDLIWPMHRIVSIPCFYPAVPSLGNGTSTNYNGYQPSISGEISGHIYGQPGKPILVEIRGDSPLTNYVVASGVFE